MLNVIVYGTKMDSLNNYGKLIHDSLSEYNIDYIISKFLKFDDNMMTVVKKQSNKKIYILDTDREDVIKKIRLYDSDSSIILISNINKSFNFENNKYMIFNMIIKNDKFDENFINSILIIISYLFKKRIFTFKYNNTIYRIPYNNINYIEKEPVVKRCIIHTLRDDYYIVDSIENLLCRLEFGFVRTHKACIVNVNNVNEIDLSKNIITFYNGEFTSLFTDKSKTILKEFLEIRK